MGKAKAPLLIGLPKGSWKMSELDEEIAAYEAQEPELLKHYNGKWVVFRGSELIGAFDTLDNAASEAVRLFGRGPYLIRQVGAPPTKLPASVMYRPIHAES